MNVHTDHDDENGMPPAGRWRPSLFRRTASPVVVAVFLVSLLWMGLSHDYAFDLSLSSTSSAGEELLDSSESANSTATKPDFAHYVRLRTITQDDISIEDPQRRFIVVGDIHGMDDSFEKLLSELSYEPKYDYIVHLGDIVAKGPHSERVLSRLTAQNMTGVRGNHDQTVIEWRGFIDWVKSQKGGRDWFDKMVDMDLSPKKFEKLKASQKKFPIPKGWKWGSIHWNIARKMSIEEYEYLRSLPLAIHVPSLHTYLVHGGLLSSDPTRGVRDSRQPLSHLPILPTASKDIDVLRNAQELSLLTDIPQNRDPWTLLNIRDVTSKGKVSRVTGDGTPWSDLWNEMQGMCKGFEAPLQESEELRKKRLPCYPTSVVYGHSAARGLDIKRWSMGIDTGCVYGRRLSALVFGDSRSKDVDEPGGEEELEEVRFGDSSKARLVSVSCLLP